MSMETAVNVARIGLRDHANPVYVGFTFPNDPDQNMKRLETGLQALIIGGSVSFVPDEAAVNAIATFPDQNGAEHFRRHLEETPEIKVLRPF